MKKIIAICIVFILPFFIKAQHYKNLEAIGPLSEGLIAVKKEGKWGFINAENKMEINFRDDIVIANYDKISSDNYPVFRGGFCLIRAYKEGIPYLGFINKKGEKVIDTQFINATNFTNGYALAIQAKKTVRGQNNYLKKDIIAYDFYEVLIDTKGEIVKYIKDIPHVLMSKEKFRKPYSETYFLNEGQLAFKDEDNEWEIILLD